ncbi:MAG: hypothetical protein KatS3mg027_2455 [Bacteroidia bacterium]|nr:MAG: hypothetical protein KatS3mg027_2455 [Bacteroidia bacterium]
MVVICGKKYIMKINLSQSKILILLYSFLYLIVYSQNSTDCVIMNDSLTFPSNMHFKSFIICNLNPSSNPTYLNKYLKAETYIPILIKSEK